MGDIIFFELIIFCSVLVFFIPIKSKFIFSLFISLALAVITGTWAVDALLNNIQFTKKLSFSFLLSAPELVIDALSAFFILLVNFTVITGLLYSKGYLQPYQKTKKRTEFSLHYFSYLWLHIAMLLVCMLRDGIAFLVVWELMSVSSFLLVIFEGEKREVLKTGINYLIQMHIGMLFLFIGFLLSGSAEGSIGFSAVGEYFGNHPNIPLFLIFFTGFGIKAGFIPLHTWLPHAHPAAPSHVSGVMSGVMIKMGIYGILRVLINVQNNLLEIGVFILVISIISGVLGVAMAIVQHDLKKLLAYHSIENIGIIGIGIGLGMIGIAEHHPALAVLGFSGGLLHVLNHSLFKSLLFYCAGSVYTSTHTREINHLGGLIKKMPHSALLFLLGALAICGLPPFNGFISEFLIYSGMFKTLNGATLNNSLLMLLGILSLAVIGGLAIFCFTKAFGITFLGTARSPEAAHGAEVEKGMLFPKYLIAIMILAIGIFPAFFVLPLQNVVALFITEDPINLIVTEQTANTLANISIGVAVFYVLCIILLFARNLFQKKVPVSYGATWGCGYTGANPAVHQYTATSFAENYKELAKPLLGLHTEYRTFAENEIFPASRKFETHSNDKIEENLITKPFAKILLVFQRLAVLQTGKLQHYMLYAIVFLILIFLLTVFKII